MIKKYIFNIESTPEVKEIKDSSQKEDQTNQILEINRQIETELSFEQLEKLELELAGVIPE